MHSILGISTRDIRCIRRMPISQSVSTLQIRH